MREPLAVDPIYSFGLDEVDLELVGVAVGREGGSNLAYQMSFGQQSQFQMNEGQQNHF